MTVTMTCQNHETIKDSRFIKYMSLTVLTDCMGCTTAIWQMQGSILCHKQVEGLSVTDTMTYQHHDTVNERCTVCHLLLHRLCNYQLTDAGSITCHTQIDGLSPNVTFTIAKWKCDRRQHFDRYHISSKTASVKSTMKQTDDTIRLYNLQPT